MTTTTFRTETIEAPAARVAAIVGALVAVKLLLPLINVAPFGYFRDELYYLACGLRPDFGYVDHPAMAPLFAVAGWKLFGETLYGVRFFPALFGAAVIVLTALMARRIGAGVFGQSFAALAAFCAPLYLVAGSKLSTDSFELLFWTGLAFITLLMVLRNDPRLWLWFGVVAGFGLHAKHSVAFFAFALLVGLAVARRDLLFNRWILFGGAVALAIALPNLIWQWQHGWPTYELLSNIKASNKNVVLGPLDFLGEQLFLLGPLAAPLWLAGLVSLLRARRDRSLRVFGVAYVAAFVLIVLLKGKNYYLGPAYPMLFAAGAVAFERWSASSRKRWLRPLYVVLLVAATALLFPIAFPTMTPEATAGYQRAIGIAPPRSEHSHTAELPQHLADRLGWEEMVSSVAKVYHALPPNDRARAGVFAQNFGEAGAIDILGRKYGLPPALSGHQNYYLWGPRGYTGNVLVVLDTPRNNLGELFTSVEYAGPAGTHPYAMPYEQQMGIYVCRGLKGSMDELWPRVKHWY